MQQASQSDNGFLHFLKYNEDQRLSTLKIDVPAREKTRGKSRCFVSHSLRIATHQATSLYVGIKLQQYSFYNNELSRTRDDPYNNITYKT